MTGDSVRNALVDRRTVLTTTAAVGGLGVFGTAVAKRGRGPPGAKGCDIVVPDDYDEVQAAVDAAAAGDTVCVKTDAEPYQEQVVINKDLTLRGVNEPRILAPDTPTQFTFTESNNSWEPVLFAFGGSESDGHVTGAGTVDVDITGVTVDGGNRQPGAQRSVGVLKRNASGGVSNNTVERMGLGNKETFGILAYGESDLMIAGNEVREFTRGGIGGNGVNGHPAPTLDVRNNRVTASGRLGQRWAPNSIQLGFGAGGKVLNNHVRDTRWAADSNDRFLATSILLFESSDVMVSGNTVTNADAGLVATAATGDRLVRNEVKDAIIGAYLLNMDNGKLVNNVLTDTSPDPTGPDDFGIINSGDNNKVIRNHITGFDVPISDQGTNSKIHANEP